MILLPQAPAPPTTVHVLEYSSPKVAATRADVLTDAGRKNVSHGAVGCGTEVAPIEALCLKRYRRSWLKFDAGCHVGWSILDCVTRRPYFRRICCGRRRCLFVVAPVIGFSDRRPSRCLRTAIRVTIFNNANILHLNPSRRTISSAASSSIALALCAIPSNNYWGPFTSLPTNINLAFFSRLTNSIRYKMQVVQCTRLIG